MVSLHHNAGRRLLMMSERNWHVNKKCLQVFFRATVVSLLVFISVGCFFAAERNSKQNGDYKDLDVANVTQSSMFGKYDLALEHTARDKYSGTVT